MQDITNMVLFARIIEEGSISAAARKLGMPKSTLSRRLSHLEAVQGLRLVHRGTRKLTLTDVGREFLGHCQAIASAVEAAEQLTKQVQAVPRGELRFSCPLALSQVALLELLPAFMHRYPKVTVHLLAVNRPVDLVEERVDVALRVRERIEDSSFIARPLAPSPGSLFASPALLGAEPPEHPLDLLKLPTLSMAYSHGRHEFALRHANGEKLTLRHHPRLITDDMAVLVAAAVAGLGVVQLPDFRCREQLASGQLVRVVPQWSPPPGIVHLVYTHRSGLLPAVRAFIDYLVETLPPSICAIMGHAGQADCPQASAE